MYTRERARARAQNLACARMCAARVLPQVCARARLSYTRALPVVSHSRACIASDLVTARSGHDRGRARAPAANTRTRWQCGAGGGPRRGTRPLLAFRACGGGGDDTLLSSRHLSPSRRLAPPRVPIARLLQIPARPCPLASRSSPRPSRSSPFYARIKRLSRTRCASMEMAIGRFWRD